MTQTHGPTSVRGEFAIDAVSPVAWPEPTSGRHLRVDLEPGGVVLAGRRVRFPGGAEWRFRRRWLTYSLDDDEGSNLASARRQRRTVFAIASPAGDYQLHIHRHEIPGWRRTREGRLVDTAGAEAATIRMSHTKECTDSDSARKYWLGTVEGFLDVRESVATPALALALRLTAGTWSRRLPKTGKWTSYPFVKTFGSSEFLMYPYWRRTR